MPRLRWTKDRPETFPERRLRLEPGITYDTTPGAEHYLSAEDAAYVQGNAGVEVVPAAPAPHGPDASTTPTEEAPGATPPPQDAPGADSPVDTAAPAPQEGA